MDPIVQELCPRVTAWSLEATSADSTSTATLWPTDIAECLPCNSAELASISPGLGSEARDSISLSEPVVDVDRLDKDGMTALMKAAFSGRVDHVQLLLKHEADPNVAAEPEQYTPLMFAAMAGATGVAQQLLWRGARRSIRNRRGKTASEIACFVGHHECASLISQYLPADVFDAFTQLDAESLQASPSLAQALFMYTNQSDLRPAQLWDFLEDHTVLLRPSKGRTWASDTAVEIIEVVARMAANLWNNNELSLKLTYLRTMFQWFIVAAGTNKVTDDDEPSSEQGRMWRTSLRMTDVIIARVCDKLQLATLAGSNHSGGSAKSNNEADGQGKMTAYLHLRALIDGPKFAAQLRDRNHCAMCYCSHANRATPNAAGEMCCSDECVEMYAQTHAGQL